MARVLIVGCGCRGRVLAAALRAEGHAVRGTTRDPARAAAIDSAGVEAAVADPDLLATLMPLLEGTAVVCWLMGQVEEPALHGPRLESFLELLVDSPVRGLVYETGAADRTRALAALDHARSTWRMPLELLEADPAGLEGWAAAGVVAVGAVLAG
jgi:putative NADH-flavin reductase